MAPKHKRNVTVKAKRYEMSLNSLAAQALQHLRILRRAEEEMPQRTRVKLVDHKSLKSEDCLGAELIELRDKIKHKEDECVPDPAGLELEAWKGIQWDKQDNQKREVMREKVPFIRYPAGASMRLLDRELGTNFEEANWKLVHMSRKLGLRMRAVDVSKTKCN